MAENQPSPRELDVLKALWGLGSASVREVHERMCPDGELAFNTVQTMLRLMEDKGLVKHEVDGRTFIYTAKYSRDQSARTFSLRAGPTASTPNLPPVLQIDPCALTVTPSTPRAQNVGKTAPPEGRR